MNKPRTGVIIGRFMPPHRGHQYLFDFAAHYVAELTIFVCSLPEEPIAGELRHAWVRAMVPGARVVHITERIPEAGRNQPNSYKIWADTMLRHMSDGVDVVFASESYGFKLAAALGARFVSVDAARHMYPISATEIRSAPFDHWEFVPHAVRPYFVKTVAVLEAGRPGEDTFAHALARALSTVAVQDYLAYWESLGMSLANESDLMHVLTAQQAAREALARDANRALVLCADSTSIAVRWIATGRALPHWFDSREGRADYYILAGPAGRPGADLLDRIEEIGAQHISVDPSSDSALPTAVEIVAGLLASA